MVTVVEYPVTDTTRFCYPRPGRSPGVKVFMFLVLITMLFNGGTARLLCDTDLPIKNTIFAYIFPGLC